jgi:hypothetical protein
LARDSRSISWPYSGPAHSIDTPVPFNHTVDIISATSPAIDATPRDRPFTPWRCPRSERADALVADVLNQLQNFESHRKLRRRKRRAQDQVTFEAAISAIVCDLVHRKLEQPAGWLAISLSKAVLGLAPRYQAATIGKTLPDLLKRLAAPEMAFLEVVKGRRGYFNNGRQTTIRAGSRLVSRICSLELSPDDFGTDNSEEVIILKRARLDRWDKGALLPYEDTPTIGLKAMFIESNILIEVLLALIDRSIVALPVHDALVVSSGHSDEVKAVMLDVFQRTTGVVGKVELERG